jgi:AcrR family transcriptional regulator
MTVPGGGEPLLNPVRQARAQATLEALIAAGLELFASRAFDQVSVAEIAAKAGVSVGGFYARFKSKEALLDAAADRVLDDCRGALDRALAPKAMATADVEKVVTAYVRVMITKFRQHRSAILMILRHGRTGSPARQAAVRAFNEYVHGRLRALLRERKAEIAHEDPDLAVNIGLFLISAAAREGVLADQLRAYPIRVTDGILVAELSRAYLAYLTSPVKARGPQR